MGKSQAPELRLSFPIPQKARTWHFVQSSQRAMSHLFPPTQGSLKGRTPRSPAQLSHDTRGLGSGKAGGETEGGQASKALSVPRRRFSPYTRGANTRPRPNIPSPPKRVKQPQHLSLLPASPSVSCRLSDRAPERSRVAPPPAMSLRPTLPPTRRRQGLLNPPAEGCRAGPPRLLPGLPARRAGAPSAAQRRDSTTDKKKRRVRSKGSALPTDRRKQPERGASRISQPSTRRRRRSGDIKQEDGAKDHRIHERPRHHRKSTGTIVQGNAVERRKAGRRQP